MGDILKVEQVVSVLKKQQGGRSVREFAKELGINAGYLSDIYAGNRTPGKTVLKAIGLEKIVRYRKVA